jgi:hypothetical protein
MLSGKVRERSNSGGGMRFVSQSALGGVLIALLLSTPTLAQDKAKLKSEARTAAAKLRDAGEPKDRCSIGVILGEGAVVIRRVADTSLQPGDVVKAVGNTDVTGKDVDDVIGILRQIPPQAVIDLKISRGKVDQVIQASCANARPVTQVILAGLDQAAAGKFDDCASSFAGRSDIGSFAPMMRLQCAAASGDKKRYDLGALAADYLEMAIEEAHWIVASRQPVVERLRATEGLITQSLGSARYQSLVAKTRQWPGGESAYLSAEPDWRLFRERGEAALKARLIDPDSARIEWPRGFLYGTWKPVLSKRVEGYWTCGLINARNRMGGYTGSTAFVVVLDKKGSVSFVDMGDGREFDIVSTQCANSAKLLPPAPAALTSATSAPRGGNASSLVDELNKLAELRYSGALTEAEFQAAKQRLLGGDR